MPHGVSDLENLVRKLVVPSSSEQMRARREIERLLSDGRVHGIRELQRVLIVADALPQPVHQEKLEIGNAVDLDSVVTADNVVIARKRLVLAASNALLDLIALGIIVPASGAAQDQNNPELRAGSFSIGYQMANRGAGVSVESHLPEFAQAYRLSPRLAGTSNDWHSDPDLFSADLDALMLPAATIRCVVEALESFRRGQFLSAVSMLGAASEGAWYAAGERLKHLDNGLTRALDEDNTVKVISRVAEVLRQDRRSRSGADELVAQSALLRQLRNYGVHPRDDVDAGLDRYLTDVGCGLLVMETHSYLHRLDTAVGLRLDGDGAT